MTATPRPSDAAPDTRGARRARAYHLLAATLFLGCALWSVRTVLPGFATTFALPTEHPKGWQSILESDQKLSAANITWNAHRFLTDPRALYEPGQCYPASRAATLGPHQLGEGLLGVLPYAVTGDPVITYNTVVVLTLWLPALAMYAFTYAFTGSAAAAFAAGLAFGFHPQRILDIVHPDVHGNQWTPLALLFAHRTFASGRWRDAAALALFLVLQIIGSMYPLLALALIGGTYGAFLAVRNFRRLPALSPPLAAVMAVTILAGWIVLGPYLHTRATWGVVGGRTSLLYGIEDFGIGGRGYPGSVLLVLAAIGLLDRLRGPRGRTGHDPRAALLVAAVLVAWSAVWGVPIPALGIAIPSLFTLAARVVPGLDAIRAGAAIGFGVTLVAAMLAGYGVLALIERRSARVRAGITAALACAMLLEIFRPQLAAHSFGSPTDLKAYVVRPSAPLLDLYAKSRAGAVLDVPYGFDPGRFFEMADGVFLAAFHLHPVGACYNSFKLPLHDDVAQMALRMVNDTRAVDELHALGFRTLMVNELRQRAKGSLFRIGDLPAAFPLIGRAAAHSAYLLDSTVPVVTDPTALAAREPADTAVVAASPEVALVFTFRNGSGATYRHPDPIEPSRMRIAWWRNGMLARADDVHVLLPIALAAGAERTRTLKVGTPPEPGAYEVTLSPTETPDLILARDHVDLASGGPAPPVAQPPDEGAHDMRAETVPPP